MLEFKSWPKTPRLFRDIVITEKIDGTNSAIIIKRVDEDAANYHHVLYTTDGNFAVGAQSRNRLITPGKQTDNYGFAGWVQEYAEVLVLALGEGTHYGEWWGKGIARGYATEYKRFTLFNTHRYAGIENASMDLIDVVPVLYSGANTESAVRTTLQDLKAGGSYVSPGFMQPEGICVYHTASSQVYKVLIENDELPKGKVPYGEKTIRAKSFMSDAA